MNRRQFLTGAAAGAAGLMVGARPAAAGHDLTKPYAGVNTHLSYFNTPYGDAKMTAEATKQLGARWARNNAIPPYEGASWYRRVYGAFRQVHDDGSGRPKTYFSIVGGHPGEPVDDTLDALAPLVDEGIIKIIEGANEWDLNYMEHGFAATTFFEELRKHQEELYTKVHARFPGVQVAGPTLFSRNAEAMGDLSYAMDLGNLHHYIVDTPMDIDDLKYLDNVMARNGKMWGTKPVIATEVGMYIGDRYIFGANTVGERVQDDGFRLLAAELGRRGVHRVFCYELVNGSRPGESATNAQNAFGCCKVESDGRWIAKPLFYPVRDACRRG